MNLGELFARAQRALVLSEIAAAVGNVTAFSQTLDIVNEDLISINKEVLTLMEMKMGKKVNVKIKPAPGGTKQPKDNQGVKPSPKGGNTGSK